MSLSKFFILCILNSRSMHGYEISKTVESATNGACSPQAGSLYAALKEFQTGGYVTVKKETANGRRRKVYTITKKGRRAFRAAVKAWSEVSARVGGACRR